MADPVSAMAVTSLIGTAVGGGVAGYGAYTKGADVQAMNNYQARIAQINAGIAGERAVAEEAAGAVRSQVIGMRGAEESGLFRARTAAGGLTPGTGSAGQVTSGLAEKTQFEERVATNEAERRAFGARVEQFGDTAQARMDIAAGQGARTAAAFDVGTSVLGAATSVSDKWTKFGQTTGPPFGQTSDNAIY